MELASGVADETRWVLLQRAVAAESGMEATLMRLAVERRLTGRDCQQFGRARQAHQQLREGIRDNANLHRGRETPEYECVKRLTIAVGPPLSGRRTATRLPSPDAGPYSP